MNEQVKQKFLDLTTSLLTGEMSGESFRLLGSDGRVWFFLKD